MSARFFRVIGRGSAVLAALVWSGCRPDPAVPTTAAIPADAVARVGDRFITREELASELTRTGPDLPRDQVLAALIRRKLLVQQAEAAGFDRSIALQAEWERLLAAKFQEAKFPSADAERIFITDSEIESRHGASLARWSRPARIQARTLFLHVPAKAEPAQRAARRSEAEALFQRWQTADDAGAAQLVRDHSEDQASRFRGGDTGWLESSRLEERFPPAVAEALSRLAVPNASALAEGPDGFHLLRLVRRDPGGPRPLVEVRDAIRQELLAEKRASAGAVFWRTQTNGVSIEMLPAAQSLLAAPIQATTPPTPRD